MQAPLASIDSAPGFKPGCSLTAPTPFFVVLLSYCSTCCSGIFGVLFTFTATFPVIRDWSVLLSSLATEGSLKPCVTSTVHEVQYRELCVCQAVPHQRGEIAARCWARCLRTPGRSTAPLTLPDRALGGPTTKPTWTYISLCEWDLRDSCLRLLHLRQGVHRETSQLAGCNSCLGSVLSTSCQHSQHPSKLNSPA